jgi:[acyl-carrier-protein] S-malonyltransferase
MESASTSVEPRVRLAWLFPGQGSQTVGMGKDLCEASKAAREVFARADAALGFPLSKLIFEGPESELTLTANAQPAIVTASVALLAAMRERVPSLENPSFAAGHSLGEYSALVAAGALSLEDAVQTVRARGEAMQSAVGPGVGAMAAVMGMAPEPLQTLCEESVLPGEVLSLANFNSPGQIVIAGNAASVAAAGAKIAEAGGKVIPLKVSAPFHCALMAPAAKVVGDKLSATAISALQFPVVANVDAEPNLDAERLPELLVRQVCSAVRWEQSVERMLALGVTQAVEIGPGKVLTGLCKRISKELKVTSVNDMATLDGWAASFA